MFLLLAHALPQLDLQNFQARCFGTDLAGTASQTLPGLLSHEHDDGLGYYPDGVKRTLTDEQIAMFRHSEIQALLRKRRRGRENSVSPQQRRVGVDVGRREHNDDVGQESLVALEEENEYARFLEQEQEQLRNDTVVKKRKRNGNAHGPRHYTREEGRENGTELNRGTVPYDSLDYGDDTAVSKPDIQVADGQPTRLGCGRKRIVYEDEEREDAVTSIPGGEKSGILTKTKMFLWPKINNEAPPNENHI